MEKRLIKMYRDGRVWIPIDIRKRFIGCSFDIREEDGKIVMHISEGSNRIYACSGKVRIPADIRKHFRDCYFDIYIENGKIVLDPVKEW